MSTPGSDSASFAQAAVQAGTSRRAAPCHTASDFVVTPEGLAALRAYDEPIPYACVERGADLDSVPPAGWIV